MGAEKGDGSVFQEQTLRADVEKKGAVPKEVRDGEHEVGGEGEHYAGDPKGTLFIGNLVFVDTRIHGDNLGSGVGGDEERDPEEDQDNREAKPGAETRTHPATTSLGSRKPRTASSSASGLHNKSSHQVPHPHGQGAYQMSPAQNEIGR